VPMPKYPATVPFPEIVNKVAEVVARVEVPATLRVEPR